jgi:hypothetical protein
MGVGRSSIRQGVEGWTSSKGTKRRRREGGMDVERKDEEGDEPGKMAEATKPLTEKVRRATREAYVLGHGGRWTYRPLSRDVLL